jgi:phospholipid transport system substrate-binding protein
MDLVRKGANADVDRVFGDTLDYDAIARDSLGDDWNGLKAAQQQQFRCLLERLVARAYHPRPQADARLRHHVRGEGRGGPGKGFLVKSVVKSRTNAREDPVSIAYVVQWNGERWRVRDIVTEGSSMVGSYESQFRRLLKRKGFEELIRKMEEKLGAVESAACRDPRPAG